MGVTIHYRGRLKYLKKRYVSSLEVSDEGGYWETGDLRALKSKMDFINAEIEELSGKMAAIPLGEIERLSADGIADRIEKMFTKDKGQTCTESPP